MDAVTPNPAPSLAGPGKSAMAPGQLAKVAVAEARAAGVEVPKNAQGLAASQIAKGADPASIFAAQIAALAPPPASDLPDDGNVPVAGNDPAVDDGQIIGDGAVTALALLQTSEDPDNVVI